MFPPQTKILVIDDHIGIRKLVRQELRALGFKDITEAEDGQMALELLTRQIEVGIPFQLIVSDWNMPKMSGIELLKAVRETPGMEQIPFLLLTAEGEFAQVKEAMKYRVTDYIVKPFTPAVLKTKLEAAWKKAEAKPKSG